MHGICKNNPIKEKWKLYEDFLDGSFVSQVLKESTIIVIVIIIITVYLVSRVLFVYKFMHHGVFI